MNKTIKKVLTASAALLTFAGVGAGMSGFSTNAHASNIYLDQYASAWEKRDGITHWGVRPKRGVYFKRNGNPVVRYYAKTFRKNGHTFLVKAVFDGPGEIIGMDGNTHVSNAKVRRALTPRRNRQIRHQRRRATKRTRRAKRVKRYNRKVRKSRRSKVIRNRRVAKKQTVLKSRFKRSNNERALKRSGFFDAHVLGGNFIFNKYAPNDKRAVVPKGMNVSNWYKGKFGQLNPTAYYYVPAVHGWLRLK